MHVRGWKKILETTGSHRKKPSVAGTPGGHGRGRCVEDVMSPRREAVRALHTKRRRRAVTSQPSRWFQSYAGTRAMHSSVPRLQSRKNSFHEDKGTIVNGKKASCPHSMAGIFISKSYKIVVCFRISEILDLRQHSQVSLKV